MLQENEIVNRLTRFSQEKMPCLHHCDSSSPGG